VSGRLIDTHSHLLPGLDDGSPDLEATVEMGRAMAVSGVSTVVCTPHLLERDDSKVERARETIALVKRRFEAEGIPLKLVLGFEVDMAVAASTAPDGLVPFTVEGSEKTIILEIPHSTWPPYAEELVFRLGSEGFLPVLAHPERNVRIQRDPGLLTACLRAGGFAQATAASIAGEFGRDTTRAFYRQLARGDVSFLASDAHHHRRSGWTLAEGMVSIRRRFPGVDMEALVRTNPARLLAGTRPLPVPTVEPRAWFARVALGLMR